MKAGQSFKCLFWAMLYCVLYLVSASEDDLMDFDFSDLKEIDWNYDNDNVNAPTKAENGLSDKRDDSNQLMQTNVVTFEDDFMDGEEKHPFDWRERMLRSALSRALTNRALRQKFVEVMPILRVLSSQQRLALSALISAQINAKKGHELRLDQVRMMFGDDKNLILPLVYDIANMVRNSARKYLEMEPTFLAPEALQQTPIERRKFDLSDVEDFDDDKDVGVVNLTQGSADSLEDFMGDVPDDVIDPKEINAELQPTMSAFRRISKARNNTKSAVNLKRSRRSTQFVHKLIRSMPLSVDEDDIVKGAAAARNMRLNTTSFELPYVAEQFYPQATVMHQPTTSATPIAIVTPENSRDGNSTISYQEIEDLAFANLNGTVLDMSAEGAENREINEPLPNPEELISGPRYRVNGNKLRQAPGRPKYASKRKRIQSRPRTGAKVPPPAASSPVVSTAPKKCERFTASMCLRTEDYPLEQIMGSIRRHKNAMSALLAEFHDRTPGLDTSDEFDDFQYSIKRREDEGHTGGGMCQSVVRFARPQKARSASGEWKYIVNTGQHTQTLRLEKCSNPQESCSYLAQSYRSHCAQVYNYHRLLSWDKSRGLHVDIFKVPTCCSCQVDGYRQQFPPLDSVKPKDFTPAHNADVYSTINEELDYNDEEDEDDLSYQYSNGFGQHRHGTAGYDENELLLGSNKVRTKVYPPSATVGSYLSPPSGDEFEPSYAYKSPQRGGGAVTGAGVKPTYGYSSLRRRPYKSLSNAVANDAHLDLEIAPSETHVDKEVNLVDTSSSSSKNFVAVDKTRAHQKRKRVFSVPHTATNTGTSTTTATHVTSSLSDGYRHVGSGAAATTTTSSSSSSTATYAHQTPSAAVGGGGGSGGAHTRSGFQPKARFRSTDTFTTGGSSSSNSGSTSTTSPTTEDTIATYRPSLKPSSSIVPPSLYHAVNSVLSAKYNKTSHAGFGNKRINYSYHPIIDFFDSNKHTSIPYQHPPTTESSELDEDDDVEDNDDVDVDDDNGVSDIRLLQSQSTVQSQSQSPSPSSSSTLAAQQEHTISIHPFKIARTKYTDSTGIRKAYSTRERRIGFGAGGGGGSGSVVGIGVGGSGSVPTDDNAWHPMITA